MRISPFSHLARGGGAGVLGRFSKIEAKAARNVHFAAVQFAQFLAMLNLSATGGFLSEK
jgi:hypothetical protein